MNYDLWKQNAPEPDLSLTVAELLAEGVECLNCYHDHSVRGGDRSRGDYTEAVPGHSDICDCPDSEYRPACPRCGGSPGDLCERGRCDDPRIP